MIDFFRAGNILNDPVYIKAIAFVSLIFGEKLVILCFFLFIIQSIFY